MEVNKLFLIKLTFSTTKAFTELTVEVTLAIEAFAIDTTLFLMLLITVMILSLAEETRVAVLSPSLVMDWNIGERRESPKRWRRVKGDLIIDCDEWMNEDDDIDIDRYIHASARVVSVCVHTNM